MERQWKEEEAKSTGEYHYVVTREDDLIEKTLAFQRGQTTREAHAELGQEMPVSRPSPTILSA